MPIELKLSALRGVRIRDFVIRFVLGGAVSVAAALTARHFGAGLGGLWLAFPAIFPAGATLLEEHEMEKHHSRTRARQAVGLDAGGCISGAFGLMAFAAVLWAALGRWPTGAAIACATLAWGVVGVTLWLFGKRL